MSNISERIYAGTLGKILGVYLGRPVEGWPYDRIVRQFGEIHYYQNAVCEAPLIVPDDDISGTFTFIRALEDNGYLKDITSRQIGESWLNYIIENQTILWWGGLSRSTEHTAFLRLKEGIPAPESGSVARNGRSMAEQIGAQIFIDGWAMVNPGDPESAAYMARQAARVSHDGIAVEAACFLAAMEAMAFSERNMETLIEEGLRLAPDPALSSLVAAVREQCTRADDWTQVRDWIAGHHGYDRYPGNCPMVTNHLVVLMSLLMGKEDFHRSISIAASAGWDTDCNAGNVGCLNGIRLGLAGIDAGIDLRTPVADRLYVVSSDGGRCISDAVIEARRLVKAASALQGIATEIPQARYAFEYPGSLQGFYAYRTEGTGQALVSLKNASFVGKKGLLMEYRGLGSGAKACACVDTFTDQQPRGKAGTSYFDVLASPTLYEGQTVLASLEAPGHPPVFKFFIEYFDGEDKLQKLESSAYLLKEGRQQIQWEVPCIHGHMIYRLGIALESDRRKDGVLLLHTLDWKGAPRRFSMGQAMELTPSLTPWTISTTWIKAFLCTAQQFYPDYTTTFSVSHPTANGVATIGTQDWKDYSVTSRLTPAKQEGAGLVARACGHRRYYAALLKEGCAVILRRRDGDVTELARTPWPYEIDGTYLMQFSVFGNRLTMRLEGEIAAQATDDTYSFGQAGFLVDSGAMLAETFTIENHEVDK